MVGGVTRNTDEKKVRYADAVDGGIGGKINRSIAMDGFRQNVRFNTNGRLIAINQILPEDELFTNYGPQFSSSDYQPYKQAQLMKNHNTTTRQKTFESTAYHR